MCHRSPLPSATDVRVPPDTEIVQQQQNVSEQRAAERQRDDATRGEKLCALGEIAGGVAHNLSQSLGMIAGYADLAERALNAPTPDVAGLRESLGIIGQAAVDGGQIVKRLLAFSRSWPDGDKERISLDDLLRDVAKLTTPRWREQARAEGRRIRLDVDAPPGLLVEGWRASLQEALINLIFNAVDALPHGGHIHLNARRCGASVVVQVQDTGHGMPPEVRERLFEPFFTTKGAEGTGLGLGTVLRLVQAHDGALEVDSTVGAGTTFRLIFPVAPAAAAKGLAAAAASAAGTPRLRILVVDDDPKLSRMVGLLLEPDGHTVTMASSGEEALTYLTSTEFDVVISDLGMGEGMDGWDLAAAVKQRSPGTTFVLATGWGAGIDGDEARSRGVNAVVSKPYRARDLQRVLAPAPARPG